MTALAAVIALAFVVGCLMTYRFGHLRGYSEGFTEADQLGHAVRKTAAELVEEINAGVHGGGQ